MIHTLEEIQTVLRLRASLSFEEDPESLPKYYCSVVDPKRGCFVRRLQSFVQIPVEATCSLSVVLMRAQK